MAMTVSPTIRSVPGPNGSAFSFFVVLTLEDRQIVAGILGVRPWPFTFRAVAAGRR